MPADLTANQYVNVLDDAIMAAVDYRLEGGLTWAEAPELVHGLLGQPEAPGLKMTIFNPTLDPDRSIARKFSEFIASCLRSPGNTYLMARWRESDEP